MKQLSILFLTLFISTMLSCTQEAKVVAEQTHSFENHVWNKFEDVEFAFSIVDTEAAHQLVLHFELDKEFDVEYLKYQIVLSMDGTEITKAFRFTDFSSIPIESNDKGEEVRKVSMNVMPLQYFSITGPCHFRVHSLMPRVKEKRFRSVTLEVIEKNG